MEQHGIERLVDSGLLEMFNTGLVDESNELPDEKVGDGALRWLEREVGTKRFGDAQLQPSNKTRHVRSQFLDINNIALLAANLTASTTLHESAPTFG